jgi:hypothetical protein
MVSFGAHGSNALPLRHGHCSAAASPQRHGGRDIEIYDDIAPAYPSAGGPQPEEVGSIEWICDDEPSVAPGANNGGQQCVYRYLPTHGVGQVARTNEIIAVREP